MALIETDMIVALISPEDRHHRESIEVIKRLRGASLSPYSLIELELLISSGRLDAVLPEFYDVLDEAFLYYNIRVVSPALEHLAIAYRLRKKYGLSFFDSLHAATAISANDVLVSFDRGYERVRELKYRHPVDVL